GFTARLKEEGVGVFGHWMPHSTSARPFEKSAVSKSLLRLGSADERQLEGIAQSFAARFDHVLRDADSAPAFAVHLRFDEHARLGSRGCLGIQNAHLEVTEVHIP